MVKAYNATHIRNEVKLQNLQALTDIYACQPTEHISLTGLNMIERFIQELMKTVDNEGDQFVLLTKFRLTQLHRWLSYFHQNPNLLSNEASDAIKSVIKELEWPVDKINKFNTNDYLYNLKIAANKVIVEADRINRVNANEVIVEAGSVNTAVVVEAERVNNDVDALERNSWSPETINQRNIFIRVYSYLWSLIFRR